MDKLHQTLPLYPAQRIITNTYGWTKPSGGRLGAKGEGEYVQENGFGHEDWNFNRDLATDGYIYGYAYYRPSEDKQDALFNFSFLTYESSQWYLVGFYRNAHFIIDGMPDDIKTLKIKAQHLLELKVQKMLGKRYANLTEKGIIQKLRKDNQVLHWKVRTEDAIRLPQPIAISEATLKNSKQLSARLTNPTLLEQAAYRKLWKIAQNYLPPNAKGTKIAKTSKSPSQSPPARRNHAASTPTRETIRCYQAYEIKTRALHHKLQTPFVRFLDDKNYPYKENVNRIDVQYWNHNDTHVLTEIKPTPDVKDISPAVRLAVGQLLEYSFYSCRHEYPKPELLIVISREPEPQVIEFVHQLGMHIAWPMDSKYTAFNIPKLK